jgi:hypothetical protein
MTGQSIFQRHPKKTLMLAALAVFVVALALTEAAFSLFFPTAISANGFVHTRGGRLYGWGFDPGQLIRREDPDTGAALARRRLWRWCPSTVYNASRRASSGSPRTNSSTKVGR